MAKWSSDDFYCVVTGQGGATKHHIYTQKAHPDKIHEPWNQMTLTNKLHTEIHTIGLVRFAARYDAAYEWLIRNKWYFDPVMLKWRHD